MVRTASNSTIDQVTRRTRVAVAIAVAICVVLITVITFWPTPVDRPAHREISDALSQLHRIGVPRQLTYSFVEFGANVALFLPLGALIAALSMPRLWWLSGVFGLGLSLCVEFGQYLFLPQRFASPYDLASNTAGAFLGGAIVGLARWGIDRRKGHSIP